MTNQLHEAPTTDDEEVHRPARRARRRLTGFLAAGLAGLILTLGMTSVADASVSSGQGSYGYATTQCLGGGFSSMSANVTARVRPEFAGQLVAARAWFYDSRGWHPNQWLYHYGTDMWSDVASFRFTLNANQSTTRYVFLAVEYGWYSNGVWRTGMEVLSQYSDLFGGVWTTCQLY